ncbi:hypothetical protein SBOR_9167 [Sclerotinia borealis F-4128]|uniref:Uncharacterized protein n=1 Tax=Sclerotinia borealis (strain F-4128) TaxID=1432307 RepID=W9C0W9_SCLBF|nr:hypothetical protein SBOR_9167 [Sclerotinia borealis F-4128]
MPPNPIDQVLADALKAEIHARIVEAANDEAVFRKQRLELAQLAHEEEEERKNEAYEAEQKRKDEESEARKRH